MISFKKKKLINYRITDNNNNNDNNNNSSSKETFGEA